MKRLITILLCLYTFTSYGQGKIERAWMETFSIIDSIQTRMPKRNIDSLYTVVDSLQVRKERLEASVGKADSLLQSLTAPLGLDSLITLPSLDLPALPKLTPELPQVSREALIGQLQTKADQMLTQLPQMDHWNYMPKNIKDLSLKEAGTAALQQLATQGEAQFQQAQQHLSAAPPTYQLQDLQKLQRLQQARQQLLDKIDIEQPAEQALQGAQGQLDKVKQKYQSIGSLQDSSSFQKKQEERSFKDFWYVGGMFHTNYSFPLQLNVAPAIGYRPWPFLLVGLGGSMQFTVERSPEFHITNNHQPGYNLFVDTYKDAWFLHLEYADTWKKVVSAETPSPSQQWLVGIGKTYQLHKRLKGRIMLLYNPKADELLQQRTWTVKWGFDLL